MKHAPRVALLLLCVAGTGAAWISMRQGVGLSPDSAFYLGGARSLLASGTFAQPEAGGVLRPVTWYPPLYSAVLAAAGLGGADPQTAARPLHAGLFALNLLLLALLGRRLACGSAAAGLLAAALALMAPSLLQVHTMIWSEALFLALCLSSALAGLRYARDRRLLTLLGLALLTSAAYLTRYVALVNIGLLGFVVVFLQKGGLRERLQRAAVLALGLLPVAAWMLRNKLCGADAAGRPVGWHPFTWAQACDTLTVLGSWVLPWRFASAATGLLVLLAVLALLTWSAHDHLRRWRRETDASTAAVWLALIAFVPVYVGFVVLTISVAAASSSLDDRLLTPVLLVVVLVVSERISWWRERPDSARTAWSLLLALALSYAGLRAALTVRGLARQGQGYAIPAWNQSATLDAVRRLPAHVLILSNAPDLLYLHAGRPATLLPSRFDINTLEPHPGWPEALRQLADRPEVVFVWLDHVTFREALPAREDILAAAGTRDVLRLEDGFVLAHPDGHPAAP